MAKRAGLGRGLSALMEEMGSTPAAERRDAQLLPLGQVVPNPHQPRRHFDQAALDELAASIRARGVLQPILVRPLDGGRYEIIAGERRWRATQLAGLHEIPALVRPFTDSDSFEVALIENVQRQDLNPVEEAEGYQRLASEYGLTQQRVSELVGKSRSHVANLLRLVELPTEVLELVRSGALTMGHAKAALGAADPLALANEIVARGWSVRQAEEAARRSHRPAGDPSQARAAAAPAAEPKDADTEALEYQLSDTLGLPVAIEAKGGKGSITIRFSDLDQLDSVIARLQG